MGRKGKKKVERPEPEEDERFRPTDAAFDEGDELDDEIDVFHRERIPLDSDESGDSDNDPADAGAVDSVLEIADGVDSDDSEAVHGAELNSVGGSDDEDSQAEEERISKAWGATRTNFYDTDYVDPDYRLEEEEHEMAEQEELEALRLQRDQLRELREEDYSVPELLAGRGGKSGKKNNKKKDSRTREEVMVDFDAALDQIGPFGKVAKEKVPKNMSKLTTDEKLARLVEAAPEALDLCTEVKVRSQELEELIKPVLIAHTSGKFELHTTALEYVQLRHRMLLVYLLNLGYYLYLRSLKTPTSIVSPHPNIRQIVRLRAQLAELDEIHEQIEPLLQKYLIVANHDSDEHDNSDSSAADDVHPESDDAQVAAADSIASQQQHSHHRVTEMDSLSVTPVKIQRMTLADARSQKESLGKSAKRKARKRRIAATEIGDGAAGDDTLADEVLLQRKQSQERNPFGTSVAKEEDWSLGALDGDESDDAAAALYDAVKASAEAKKSKSVYTVEQPELEGVTDDNRAITYAMQKNRGLTPSRRKEMRNPRVRHRNKFTKATKRRKGQVIEMRSQESKYTGEAFGIRTDITKSTKLK